MKAGIKERNPEKTRQEILQIAFEEIFRKGYNGTSTNDIISKIGATRGAFFHHFPTKDDLGYALIDDVLRGMILQRWIEPIQDSEDPIKALIKNFRERIEETPDSSAICGCPLNNLAQELSSSRPDFQKRLKAVMTMWIDETEKLLKKAKALGHLKSSTKTRPLAEFIVACQESAFAMGKVMNDRKIMNSIYGSLKRLLTES